jgi:hypothetical protein
VPTARQPRRTNPIATHASVQRDCASITESGICILVTQISDASAFRTIKLTPLDSEGGNLMRHLPIQKLALCGALVVVSALPFVACSSGQDTGFLSSDRQQPGPIGTTTASGTAGEDGGSQPPPSSNDAGSGNPQNGHDAGMMNPPPGMDASMPPAMDASTAPPNGFDQFQEHNLEVVNMYRATLNIAPLVLDKQLCTFALAGSQELTMDHTPHQHFINAGNDGSLWMSGFTSQAAENQGDPNGWTVLASDPTQNELMQIDSIQKAMFDEGPGMGEAHGHYENMMNPALKRLGVGLIEVNGSLYLTNDFSD